MTRLIEILISLAIVAALFVIIGVVLPSSRHVTESIETNRKMTIVRDTLSSPRRFKDWNVLALKDPRMEWKFFGPDSGQGAGFEYAFNDKQVGKGKWTLTKAEPTRLEYDITDETRGSNKKAVFVLKEMEDCDTKEIARILSCGESTVRNHLFNARRILRRELARICPGFLEGRRR